MKVFMLDVYDRQDEGYCFLTRPPEAVYLLSSYIVSGKSAKDRYPANVVAKMADDRGGIVLSDIIANKNLSLIVSKGIKEIIEESCGESCEYLPVSIQNRKGRIASEDYFYINPLGSYDVLDYDKAVIKYTGDGKVIKVRRFVFSEEKLKGVPAIFRVKENPKEYFVSKELADTVKRLKPDVTNLNLQEMQVIVDESE